MPPKSAAGATKSARGGGAGRGRPKKQRNEEEDDEDFSDEEEEMQMAAAASRNKRKSKKKPTSEDDEEDEEDEEDLDEEDLDEEDEEEEDEEENGGGGVGKEKKSNSKAKKTLFIKNLPENTSEDDIKALSPDIQEVRIDVSHLKGEKNPKYAILDFADAESAAKTLELLKGKQVNGADVVIDFIGGRSAVTYTSPTLNASSDLLKLYVTGFGRDITMDQLKQMFPTSIDITLPLDSKNANKPVGYAFIHYAEESVCRAAHDSMQDHVYQSRTLVVMYGKKSSPEGDKADNKRKATASPGRGRPKKAKKEESKKKKVPTATLR